MSWAKIDDRANENLKQLEAGPAACWLWACGLMYCNRHSRTGYISKAAVRTLFPVARPLRLARRLVSTGLWVVAPGGFQVHDYVPGTVAPSWNKGAYPAVYARDGEVCRYCGADNAGTIDHVVPRCQGGSDRASNLVVACRPCNSRKGGRTPEQAGMVLL